MTNNYKLNIQPLIFISLAAVVILGNTFRFKIVIFAILPLTYSGLVATATYGFLVAWSEYILALTLLTDDNVKTLPLSLAQFFGDDTVQWGPLMAGCTITIIPTLILFLPLQKKLISGLTQGALK